MHTLTDLQHETDSSDDGGDGGAGPLPLIPPRAGRSCQAQGRFCTGNCIHRRFLI